MIINLLIWIEWIHNRSLVICFDQIGRWCERIVIGISVSNYRCCCVWCFRLIYGERRHRTCWWDKQKIRQVGVGWHCWRSNCWIMIIAIIVLMILIIVWRWVRPETLIWIVIVIWIWMNVLIELITFAFFSFKIFFQFLLKQFWISFKVKKL